MEYDKLEVTGYIVRGPHTHTDAQDVLENVGDEDFYKPTIR